MTLVIGMPYQKGGFLAIQKYGRFLGNIAFFSTDDA